jgi:hypothetical protein
VLDLIHTDDFAFFIGSEVKPRDLVDDEHDRVRNDKGPSQTDHNPSELKTELSEVAIEPSSGDRGVSLQKRDGSVSKGSSYSVRRRPGGAWDEHRCWRLKLGQRCR